jgi:endonuclease-3 related protein
MPRTKKTTAKTLQDYYQRMASHYGPTHWWPGDTPYEIALGAILTQNTNWTNVERAIQNLKQEKLLTPTKIHDVPLEQLETAIRPSGYFRQKAERLKIFTEHLLTHYRGSLKRMALRPLVELREELLSLKGIGPETADDILLYACEKPIFVVDEYTRRILSRHELVPPTIKYHDLQQFVHDHFPEDLHHYKELHGLIVWTGKDFCRKTPQCENCPLGPLLKPGQPCSM